VEDIKNIARFYQTVAFDKFRSQVQSATKGYTIGAVFLARAVILARLTFGAHLTGLK